ncbi:hypothetical protein GCM10009733_023160 [Nonomuraea maheshkhaliensis]|uniref:Uncharacterized protein n=1 Tax=Nonomuraea maheshkhaliensis TaxID=419590 RepID=A0ABP4QX21_9ACTN
MDVLPGSHGTARQHSERRERTAGGTLIRRYAVTPTPAGQALSSRSTATAIPPLSGGADVHRGEATHTATISERTCLVTGLSRVRRPFGPAAADPFGLVAIDP